MDSRERGRRAGACDAQADGEPDHPFMTITLSRSAVPHRRRSVTIGVARALLAGVLLSAVGAPLRAQVTDTVVSSAERTLPRDVQREAARLFNETAALRSDGRVSIQAGQEVRGNVAILNGPLTIGGRVTGRVIAINADVELLATSKVDGDLVVVGGRLRGLTDQVTGEVRHYTTRLAYRRVGESIEAELVDADPTDDRWREWWERRRRARNSNVFSIASAGVYNRVEGLPILIGPELFRDQGWGAWRASARAIVRTGSSFNSEGGDIGHDAFTELRIGRRDGVALRGRLFNVVAPAEAWQLGDLETALASFLFRRDYRDYFSRHGASAGAAFLVGRRSELGVTYSHERWGSRVLRNPLALFADELAWRPNPRMDEGRMHLTTVRLRTDTRNAVRSPRAGWLLDVSLEHGRGTLDSLAATSPGVRTLAPGPTRYSRAFADLRRYNRVGPNAQLNARLVLGGWVGGDPLPLQRRLSVDGPGTVPGFDFRSQRGGDAATCSGGVILPGQPAQCDRVAVAQVEYRTDLDFDFVWDDDGELRRKRLFEHDGSWVVFANAGRGWLVGEPAGTLRYARDGFPALSTFRTDLGVGLDFDIFGVYAAKAVSHSGEPVNLFVRVRHRF